MKDILKFLSGKNRILVLFGRSGIGKTSIVKHVSKYAFERKLFKNGVIYLDMKGKKFIHSINKMLAKKLNSPLDKSNKQIERLINSLHVMIIIDNLDSISSSQLLELETKICSFRERTQYPKICLVVEKGIKIDQADYYEIGPLKETAVGSMFKANLEENLYKEVRSSLKKLIQTIDCSPSTVWKIITLIKEKPIEKIFDELGPSEIKKSQTFSTQETQSIETESLNLFLAYMKTRIPESIIFFKMLSFFPAGVYRSDLAVLCDTQEYDYNEILTILSRRKNSLLDLSSNILTIPESLKNYLFSVEKKLGKSVNSYKYLSLLAQTILLQLMDQPSVKSLEILKSLTNLFFRPHPQSTKLASIQNSSFADLQQSFKEMEKNFDAFLTTEEIPETDLVCVCQSVFEICLFCVRIYLIFGEKRTAEAMIKKTIIVIKNHGQNILKAKLKIIQAAILYEYNGNVERLEKLVKKALLYFDHQGSDVLDYLGESHLLMALIKIENPSIIVYSEVDKSLLQAETIFNTLNLTAEKARFYLAKFDWLLLTNTLNTKNEEFVENLENARKIFAQMKFFGLEIKSVFYIGEFYIRRQK